MYVIDELTRKSILFEESSLIVLDYIQDQLIYGYAHNTSTFISVSIFIDGEYRSYLSVYELIKDRVIYSNYRGCYMFSVGLCKERLSQEQYILGQGDFPYNFPRRYEAIDNFYLFKNKQKIKENINYPLSDYLHYTLGLEFETSAGYIPENLCFENGLIPLRDGSISGLEYSTVILSGNDGINLLKQQLDTLRKYTVFNKDCSLHVHLGGFPLNENSIFRLYQLCSKLESNLRRILPTYTFNTSLYKSTGKEYCKKLKHVDSFNLLYEYLVGCKFYGSFTQPHPSDIKRVAKWRINSRYYWVNIINLLCYDVNKTVEFRFLRPTYNFKKIILWLYIFNAILKYAESNSVVYSNISLIDIIRSIYPNPLANELIDGVYRINILSTNQRNCGDLIGDNIYFEDKLFPDTLKY